MKISKQKILSFICGFIILFTTIFSNIEKVYAMTEETAEQEPIGTADETGELMQSTPTEENITQENESMRTEATSNKGYTTINSQTLLDSNSLDALVLNYASLPNITVTGSEKYSLINTTSLLDNSVAVKQVEFPDARSGKVLDSVVTVKFNNCGKLNGKTIDMKLIYSDIVVKGDSPFLYWSAYGNSMTTNNEWWYSKIEHITINIYFYYSGSNTPITLDTAYLSLFSEDRNEGASSKVSSNQYLYEKTYMNYLSSTPSQCISRTYQNVFHGTVGSLVGGNTEAGTLKCVSFQYQKTNHLEVELYALNNKVDIGYHLQYTSLTASIPNNSKKLVDKTVANTRDTITYTITQNISKSTDQDFYYTSLVFRDTLNSNVSYQSLNVYDENNKDVTATAGSTNYNSATNTLDYKFNTNYLKNINYKGQAYKFIIKAKVKNHITEGNITNTSTTIINDKYTLSSNTVTSKISYKVLIDHVDEEGNKLAETETIKGYEGDSYTTKEKQIYGYELIEIPENSIGSMTEDTITVTYCYKVKNSNVVAEYVDEKGKKLAVDETIQGKVFREYQTEAKDIYGYELIETPENHTGTMTEETIIVTYRYELKNSSVITRYIDEDENILADDEMLQGKVFDEYTTHPKEIYGYELIEMPKNSSGRMIETPMIVTYRYRLKDTNVIAKFVDEQGNEIAGHDTILGKVFDEYQAEEKDIYGYELIETPENHTGIMTEESIIVTYRYQLKDTSVIAKYIDEEGKELANSETMQGKVFDDYKTQPKEIRGYELVKMPENNVGTMTEYPTTVTYQYRKLEFNIAVAQKLTGIILNNEPKDVSGKLEIDRKIDVSLLKLTYTITVSNPSELDGCTVLHNTIPDGYVALEQDNLDWKIDGKDACRNIDNLVIGEAREFPIVLTATSNEVAGTIVNVASCKDSTCEPQFEESTLADNTDTKELIIGISTGLTEHLTEIVLEVLVVLIVLGTVLWKVRKRRIRRTF